MSVSDDDDSWGCSCGFDILKYFLDQIRVLVESVYILFYSAINEKQNFVTKSAKEIIDFI